MRKAFTLIELMVVIGILLVLIGVTVIGLSQIGENQKTKTTQHVLEGLVSMHEEYKAKTNLRDIQTILVDQTVRAVNAAEVDQKPFDNPAIVQTQRIMKKMLSIPTNKTMMQQLPSDRFMWELPAGVAASSALEFDGSSKKLKYPLPLDAWGKPIIYVPPPDVSAASVNWNDRYGLNEVYLKQDPSSPQQVLNPRQGYPKNKDFVMLQTFRPFWASAGPDGMFGYYKEGNEYFPKGDDNVYSFEN